MLAPVPIGVDVLTQQRDLDNAFGDQGLYLGEDLVRCAVLLLAPQRGHDAEGARVVAADADRDPPTERRLPPGGQVRRKLRELLEDLHLSLLPDTRPVQQIRQRAQIVGPEHHIHPRRPVDDDGLVLLGQASSDRDLKVRVGLLQRPQMPEVPVQPVVCVLPYSACVEHDQVRCLALVSGRVTGTFE